MDQFDFEDFLASIEALQSSDQNEQNNAAGNEELTSNCNAVSTADSIQNDTLEQNLNIIDSDSFDRTWDEFLKNFDSKAIGDNIINEQPNSTTLISNTDQSSDNLQTKNVYGNFAENLPTQLIDSNTDTKYYLKRAPNNLYPKIIAATPVENQRNTNQNFQSEGRMVALAPNECRKTENAIENVNVYTSSNYLFLSPPELINIENIPYFGEFPPIPNFIQSPPEMLQRGLLPNTIQIKPVGNPPFGYYIPPVRKRNMDFSTNVNNRNVRIQGLSSNGFLKKPNNKFKINNQRQPFLNVTFPAQNFAAPLTYNMYDNYLLQTEKNATISQEGALDSLNTQMQQLPLNVEEPFLPNNNNFNNQVQPSNHVNSQPQNLYSPPNRNIQHSSLLPTQFFDSYETQPQNNSAPTPQVNSDVSNIIDEYMQIQSPGELVTPALDNLYPPIQCNTDASTRRIEINQIDALNSEATDNWNLSPNIVAIVSTTKYDVIEKQPSVSVRLPIDDVSPSTSIDTTTALHENQHPRRRRSRKQSFKNLTSMPEDEFFPIPEHSSTNADTSNKENCEMQNSVTSKPLRCNKRTVAAARDKCQEYSSKKLLNYTQTVSSVKRLKTVKQTKKQPKKKQMQIKSTPKRKCRAVVKSYKEDSDEVESLNDTKIDKNVTKAPMASSHTELNSQIRENQQLVNTPPNLQIVQNMHHTRTFQQVFVEFVPKRAQNNTWQKLIKKI